MSLPRRINGSGDNMETERYYFENSKHDGDRIKEDAVKIADEFGLEKSNKRRLVLLAEEAMELLPTLVQYGKGSFYIENDDRYFKIHIDVELNKLLNEKEYDRLLSISKTGENAASVGVMNKIRIAAQLMIANVARGEKKEKFDGVKFYKKGARQSKKGLMSHWSLEQYRIASGDDEKAGGELERSIISNLADDVEVAVLGKKISVTIKRWFDPED